VASRSSVAVVVVARAAVRDLIRSALVATGIEIAGESSDLAEAMQAVAHRRPELCVLDRDLPGASVTAIAALATPRPRPRVLVIGGSDEPAGVRADRLAGAARCLPGRVHPGEVAAALQELAGEVTR
jgi:DNA-binding NarL/FixJ family response regulator